MTSRDVRLIGGPAHNEVHFIVHESDVIILHREGKRLIYRVNGKEAHLFDDRGVNEPEAHEKIDSAKKLLEENGYKIIGPLAWSIMTGKSNSSDLDKMAKSDSVGTTNAVVEVLQLIQETDGK